MRIALSDDPWGCDLPLRGARVRLDEETGPCAAGPCPPQAGDQPDPTPASPGWSLTVRARSKRGRDVDGVALYGWDTVWEGRALAAETGDGLALSRGRQETSDAAGQALETRTALLPGAHDLGVTETAVAWDDAGRRWEISGVADQPGGIQLRLQRVADDRDA